MTDKKAAHKNIHVALCAAQSEMPRTVKKGSDNPHFKSKYASLEDVVTAIGPHLNAHGIVYYSYIVAGEPFPLQRTELYHGDTDTSIACDVPLIIDQRAQNMQGFKSATTYAKRIGFESVTGVAPSDDDDGNAAAATAPSGQTKSAYSLKGHGKNGNGDNQWNKVMAQLSVEIGELRETQKTRTVLMELRTEYRKQAVDDGWPQAWLESLDDEFAKIAKEWGVSEKQPENILVAG